MRPVLALAGAPIEGPEVRFQVRLMAIGDRAAPEVWDSADAHDRCHPGGEYLELNEATTPVLVNPGEWYALRGAQDRLGLISGLALWLALVPTPDLEMVDARKPTDAELASVPEEVLYLLRGSLMAVTGVGSPTALIARLDGGTDGRRLVAAERLSPIPIVVAPDRGRLSRRLQEVGVVLKTESG